MKWDVIIISGVIAAFFACLTSIAYLDVVEHKRLNLVADKLRFVCIEADARGYQLNQCKGVLP